MFASNDCLSVSPSTVMYPGFGTVTATAKYTGTCTLYWQLGVAPYTTLIGMGATIKG